MMNVWGTDSAVAMSILTAWLLIELAVTDD